jgi:hypothetical protein
MTCAHTKRSLQREHLIYCASITALWQLPAETSSSDAWQLVRNGCWILPTMYLFHTRRVLNYAIHLTKWDRRLYKRSEESRATGLYIYLLAVHFKKLFQKLRLHFIEWKGDEWIMKDFDGNGRGLIWSYSGGTCLEGLRGTTKNLTQDSQSPGRNYGLRSPLKTHGPRPGLNPRNLGPIARTLPLNHRGRLLTSYSTASNFSGCSLIVTAEAYVIIL